MNDRQRREYRRLRQDGHTAMTALAIVRDEGNARSVPWMFGEMFEQDGFDVIVTIEPEDDVDYSHLGKFVSRSNTHHSEGYVLRNPNGWNGQQQNHRSYAYFELMNPVPVVARDLIERCKFGRRQAWETAWKSAKADLERAIDYATVTVVVTVSLHGIELGTDALGGCDGDSELYHVQTVLYHGMIDNAINDARRNLVRLCAKEAM